MIFDYSKLKGRIREKFMTQEAFAKRLGMSRTTFSLKLNDVSEFSQREMLQALNLLDVNVKLIDEYFFTLKVKKTEQEKKAVKVR